MTSILPDLRLILRMAILLVLVGLLPALAPYHPLRTAPENQNQPPSVEHPFGTDYLGRDIFSRILSGGQITVTQGMLAAALAVMVGGALALLRTAGRLWDEAARLWIDALLSLPNFMIALLMLAVLGQGSSALIVAVGIAQIAPFAQVMRAALIAVEGQGYVEGAIAGGASRWWVLTRHLLPSSLPVIGVQMRVTCAYCLLNSAALGFLGFGGEPGTPEWGMMLAEGRFALRSAPWAAIIPGTALTLLVMLVNTPQRR